MRWLLVQPGPDFSVYDVFQGWREALEDIGEQVIVYNTSDRLTFYDSVAIETGYVAEDGTREFRKALDRDEVTSLAMQALLAAAMACWPDVVLLVSGFFVDWHIPAILRARGIKVVLLCTEAPYEDPRQLELAPHADVTLLNDPVTMPLYLDVCDTVAYSPHAFRPSVHYPRKTRNRYDLVFSGTGYESRIAFLEGMGLAGESLGMLRDLKVALAGNWVNLPEESPLNRYLLHDRSVCLDNADTAALYGRGRAGINFYRREAQDGGTAEGWAVGPREIEMAACGLWFLRDPRGEGDELFPQLPVFEDAHTAGELLRWGLRHADIRARGAAAAREAIQSRTFVSNAKMLLRLLDGTKTRGRRWPASTASQASSTSG